MRKPEYKIKTLEDFDQIPEDRLGACLTDFSAYIQFVKEARANGFKRDTFFIWKDDGIEGISEIRITLKEPTNDPKH